MAKWSSFIPMPLKIAAQWAILRLAPPRLILFFSEPLFWFFNIRRRKPKTGFLQSKKLLVVRLDEIGDVVLTTPFLRELRRNFPRAKITLVVKSAIYNLVELCPYIDEILTYDGAVRGWLSELQKHYRALKLAANHFWSQHFDLAILPRWDVDSHHGAFLVYFSGASWRIGYSEHVIGHKQVLNYGHDCLFTHVLDSRTLKHEVDRNLQIIRFLGGTVREDKLELWTGEADENFVQHMFKQYDIQTGDFIIGFGPSGGNSSLKQWPINSFIELAHWLREKYGSRTLVIGGADEKTLGQEIEQAVGSSVINMVGKTSLRQATALLKRCRLYVGNDTGPMHMAAAMKIPVVALFGSSCHHRFGPCGNNKTVLCLTLPCSPCSQVNHLDRCKSCVFDRPHCILGITVSQVQQAVEKIFYNDNRTKNMV